MSPNNLINLECHYIPYLKYDIYSQGREEDPLLDEDEDGECVALNNYGNGTFNWKFYPCTNSVPVLCKGIAGVVKSSDCKYCTINFKGYLRSVSSISSITLVFGCIVAE